MRGPKNGGRSGGFKRKLNIDKEITLDFAQDILPSLKFLPLCRIMEATELSLRYCYLIRGGSKVSHPRHWHLLRTMPTE